MNQDVVPTMKCTQCKHIKYSQSSIRKSKKYKVVLNLFVYTIDFDKKSSSGIECKRKYDKSKKINKPDQIMIILRKIHRIKNKAN